MTMYRLVVPSGHEEITIGMQYGSVTFKNGQVMPDSEIVRLYPQYFFAIPEAEPVVIVKEELVEKIEKVIEQPITDIVELIESIETTKPVEVKVEAPVKVKGKPGPKPKKKLTL